MLLDKVRSIRKNLPRIGAEKLHEMTANFCQQHGIKVGRDRFTLLLKDKNMLVSRRTRRVTTTISHHHYFKYPNLFKCLKVTRPNMLWVSDITYMQVLNRFSYLSLITDTYSRKVVGWSLWIFRSMLGSSSILVKNTFKIYTLIFCYISFLFSEFNAHSVQ
jgi:putative transposase